MPTYTVISQTERAGFDFDSLTVSPIAAIAGRVEVYGFGLHIDDIDVDSPDAAMDAVRGKQVWSAPAERGETVAAKWTAIGLADNGPCPSWSVVALVVGEHKVLGRYESMLSHRWDRVVDNVSAISVASADRVAWKLAAEVYEEAWN